MIEIITKTSRYEVSCVGGKQLLYRNGQLLGRVYNVDMKKIKAGNKASFDYYRGEDLWTTTLDEIVEVRV